MPPILPKALTSGSAVQCMPLLANGRGETTGAADIDVTGKTVIEIFGTFNLSVGIETEVIPIEDYCVYSVQSIDLIHVSAAVKYNAA